MEQREGLRRFDITLIGSTSSRTTIMGWGHAMRPAYAAAFAVAGHCRGSSNHRSAGTVAAHNKPSKLENP